MLDSLDEGTGIDNIAFETEGVVSGFLCYDVILAGDEPVFERFEVIVRDEFGEHAFVLKKLKAPSGSVSEDGTAQRPEEARTGATAASGSIGIPEHGIRVCEFLRAV